MCCLQYFSITNWSGVTLHLCVYLTVCLPLLDLRMFGVSLLAQYSILLKTLTASTSQDSLTTNAPSHSLMNFSCPWSSSSLSAWNFESRRLSWAPSIDLTHARNTSVGRGVGHLKSHWPRHHTVTLTQRAASQIKSNIALSKEFALIQPQIF